MRWSTGAATRRGSRCAHSWSRPGRRPRPPPRDRRARAAQIVILAVPGEVVEQVGNDLGLDGKIVVGVSGGLKRVGEGGYLELVSDSTHAERIQARHPAARVVRIYLPSIFFFVDPPLGGTPPSVLIAVNGPRAREAVARQQKRAEGYDLKLLPSPPLSCFFDPSAVFGFGRPYDLDSLPRFPRRGPPIRCDEWRRQVKR